MSQIAWWTLDGHLKDSIQNNNMVVTGNGITIDNVGKIGKCYKSSRVKEYLKSSNKYKLMGSQSYCCWFKIMSDNDDWGALISTYNHTDRTGLALVIHKVTGGFNINITAGFGNDYSNNMCQQSGRVLNYDTWYHATMVYDSTERYFKIFINGELYAKSTSINDNLRFYQETNIYVMTWDNVKRYFSSMKINDVRIFNHALSLKEVREIAKAKILHVDFSQEVNNINVVVNTNKIVTNWVESGVTVELMDDMVTPDGGKVYKLKKTGSDPALLRDCGNGYSSDVDAPIKYNKYYTFYLWCKKGDTDGHISIDISDTFSGGATLTDEWKLVKASGMCTTGYAFTDIFIPFTDGHYCYISQPQTTEGTNTLKIIDPVNNNRNTKLLYNGKIIDKSGFGNDFSLENYGPTKWDSDSSVGMGSMFFDNGVKTAYRNSGIAEYIQSINRVFIPEQFTLSYWCKGIPDLSFNSYRRQNIYSTGWEQMCSCEGSESSNNINQTRCGLIYRNDITKKNNYFNSYDSRVKLHDGNWHNMIITIDCINKKGKIYYDGIKIKESTELEDFSYHNSFRYFIIGSAWGTSYGPWFGNLADIRVYATYLSDEDCIALYNQKASLAKNGTLFTSNFNESKHLSTNRVDYTKWRLGTSGSQEHNISDNTRTASFYSISNTDVNEIVKYKNPKNEDDIMWKCISSGDGEADGGFNTKSFNIDKSKIYRCSIWIKRSYTPHSGNWYSGLYVYDSSGNNTPVILNNNSTTTNHYFYSSASSYKNDWFLVVGYILPNDISDSLFKDTINYKTKIYNSNGKLLTTSDTKCKFPNNAVKMSYRSYLFYGNGKGIEQYFYRPRVDLLDGTEPSIDDLIHLRECDNVYKLSMNGVTKESVFTEEEFSEVGNLELVSAYYPLLEDFKDYSGNNLHLAEYGNPTDTPTTFTGNGTKFFQKTGKYLAYAKDNILFNLSNTFTISFNFKLNENITNVNAGMKRTTLFEKDLYNKDFSINITEDNGGLHIQLYLGNGSEYRSFGAPLGNISDFINKFNNIILIKNKRMFTVFVNGRKIECPITGDVNTIHGTGALRIGSGYCSTSGCILNHVKIFKRELLEYEALTEYKWYSNQAKMLINSKNKMYTTQLIED